MFGFASGQLVLVALTACVAGQSSGFLKSQASDRNIFPVVAALQKPQSLSEKEGKKERSLSEKQTPNLWTQTKAQMETKAPKKKLPVFPTQTQAQKVEAANRELYAAREKIAALNRPKKTFPSQAAAQAAALAAANVREDAALKRTWQMMEQRHTVQQQQLQAAMNKHNSIMTKRYACTDAGVRAGLVKKIARERLVAQQGLATKQAQEKHLFMARMKCMQSVPGDQSLYASGPLKVPGRAQVNACMKLAFLEKAPVALEETKEGAAAVKKQTDAIAGASQQMKEHAMNDELPVLFNTDQKDTWEMEVLFKRQMEDAWEKDNKKELQKCDPDQKNVFNLEREKADVSEFTEALVDAKKVIAEAREAVAKDNA